MTVVVVFGGAGFLGRRLVHRLTAQGMTVRVAVRHPDPARIALLDRVTVVPADVRDQASVAAAIAGADAVVNTVSAYVEKGGLTFEAVHVQGAETVARETVAAGVPRLVLVSGIGANADFRVSLHPCSRTRRTGGPADVSGGYDRPPGRHVWSGRRIVRHARRVRPTASDTAANRRRPHPTAASLCGRRGGGYRQHTHQPRNRRPNYELAGPGVYTLRELVTMTLHLMRKRRLLIPVPFAVTEIQARLFELLPNPPLTTGQVDLLKADNVVSGTLPGFRELNIQPKTVEEVVPTYIGPRASGPH